LLFNNSFGEFPINLEEEIEKLNSQGIVHSIRNIRDLDEAPEHIKTSI